MDLDEQLRDVTRGINDVTALVEDLGGRMTDKIGTLTQRMNEMDQKLVRRGGGGSAASTWVAGGAGGSLGSIVANSDELKRLLGLPGRRGRAQIAVPSESLAAITTVSGSGGPMLSVDRRVGTPDDIIMAARRRLTVRALLAPGRTSSNAVEFAASSSVAQ